MAPPPDHGRPALPRQLPELIEQPRRPVPIALPEERQHRGVDACDLGLERGRICRDRPGVRIGHGSAPSGMPVRPARAPRDQHRV
jgi:hypothetical protein